MEKQYRRQYRQDSILLCALLCFLVILSGCTASRKSESAMGMSQSKALNVNRNENNYVIQPGDQITVTVWNHDKFNINQTVSSDGTLAYPLLGEIKAEGLSKSDFISMLKKKLSDYIKGSINVTVSISRPNNKEVSILGSVSKPANYPMDKSTSILRVLADAGGPTDNADLHHVQVLHPGHVPNRINLDIYEYFETTSDQNITQPPYQVQPGEIIYIPKSDNVVRDLSGFLRDAVILFGVFRVFN